MREERLFPSSRPLIEPPSGKVSKRTYAAYEAACRRLGKMHGKFGHGDGRECRGCVHLIHRYEPGFGRNYLKCELYNSKGYDSTDWRAKWPACGAWASEGSGRRLDP